MGTHLGYDPATGHLVYSPTAGHLARTCDSGPCPSKSAWVVHDPLADDPYPSWVCNGNRFSDDGLGNHDYYGIDEPTAVIIKEGGVWKCKLGNPAGSHAIFEAAISGPCIPTDISAWTCTYWDYDPDYPPSLYFTDPI